MAAHILSLRDFTSTVDRHVEIRSFSVLGRAANCGETQVGDFERTI